MAGVHLVLLVFRCFQSSLKAGGAGSMNGWRDGAQKATYETLSQVRLRQCCVGVNLLNATAKLSE